jgi:putative redox protein
MLLSGLGSCTAIVLHTYAQHHGVDLQEVELRLNYDRIFADDCVQCEDIQEYREQIEEEITLIGNLTPEERKRLFMVSKHCPIHKMLQHGIEVKSYLGEE